MRTDKFEKALAIIPKLEPTGKGNGKLFFRFKFEKEVLITYNIDNDNFEQCTCKYSSIYLEFDCVYCLAVRLWLVIPKKYLEKLMVDLSRHS